MKKCVLLIMAIVVLLSCMGCAKEDIKREMPASASYQLLDQHTEFERERSNSNILFCICASVVIAGILFKVAAIFSGVVSGCILSRKEKKAKNRRNIEDIGGQTTYQLEQQRYHDYYMEARKKREERRKRDG